MESNEVATSFQSKRREKQPDKFCVKLHLLPPKKNAKKISKCRIVRCGAPPAAFLNKDNKVEFPFSMTTEEFKAELVEIYPKLNNVEYSLMKADTSNNLVRLNLDTSSYNPKDIYRNCHLSRGKLYIRCEEEPSQTTSEGPLAKRPRNWTTSENQSSHFASPVYPMTRSRLAALQSAAVFTAPPIAASVSSAPTNIAPRPLNDELSLQLRARMLFSRDDASSSDMEETSSNSRSDELDPDDFVEKCEQTGHLEISPEVFTHSGVLERLRSSSMAIHWVKINKYCKLDEVLERFPLPLSLKVLTIKKNCLDDSDIKSLVTGAILHLKNVEELDLSSTELLLGNIRFTFISGLANLTALNRLCLVNNCMVNNCMGQRDSSSLAHGQKSRTSELRVRENLNSKWRAFTLLIILKN